MAAYFLPVVLPFFMAWVVEAIGVAVNALLDAAASAAGAAAFFLFLFVLAAAGGTALMRGRAGGTRMTSIL